ncbi:hypothetical protein GEMRC1_011100 [Eukaryota sp. GEM-RC1]
MDCKKKVVLVGDAGTGKTSLIQRFTRHSFNPSYSSTVGIDFFSKSIYFSDRDSVQLLLWDTAGQEKFSALVPSYLRDCSAAIIVFDVTDRKSYDNALSKWLTSVQDEQNDDILVVLVGNKVDLSTQRVISTSELSSKASSLEIPYFECSARIGLNVKDLFQNVALLLSKPGKSASNDAEEEVVKDTLLTVDLNQTPTKSCSC